MADSIVIVSAARTPIGGLLGDFASLAAWELGAVAIKAAVERAGVPGDAIDEVLFGNCLMAGQGQAPARQALRKAGLPDSAGAVTLSKMCGSGMRAAMFAQVSAFVRGIWSNTERTEAIGLPSVRWERYGSPASSIAIVTSSRSRITSRAMRSFSPSSGAESRSATVLRLCSAILSVPTVERSLRT